MLEVKNLKKYFGDSLILDDVDAKFKEGYIYGVVGRNGVGKSTFLRHLCGIYKQDSGEVLYNNEIVLENNKVKKEIIFISDSHTYFNNTTINKLKKGYEVFYDFDNELFKKLSLIFNLDYDANINKFSKGMKKQAEFILGLCCKPKVLIMDETFDGVDTIILHKMKTTLVDIIEKNKITIIISTHNLKDLDNICDYIYVLDSKKLSLQKDFESRKKYYKVQLYFNDKDLDDNFKSNVNLNILKIKKIGSITYAVIDDDIENIKIEINKHNPIIFELLPFTFEEQFIFNYSGGEVNE